jgi:hypothetical protein
VDLETAKALILRHVNEGKWIQRAADGKSVTVESRQFQEPAMLEALEMLYREGLVVQVASAGQAQTAISFKKSS